MERDEGVIREKGILFLCFQSGKNAALKFVSIWFFLKIGRFAKKSNNSSLAKHATV